MKLSHRFLSILFVAGTIIAAVVITPLHAQSADEKAVLAPINAMFDAMAKHDVAAFKQPLLPGGSLTLMRNCKPVQLTFDQFAEAIGKPSKSPIEERIHDPLVKIDNDLAVVWAAFDFLVDGKVDHCGTDIAHLVKHDGKWLIAGIADNGRKECAPAK